jgi:SOS regulatory protein LexA
MDYQITLSKFYRANKRMPSYTELMRLWGYKTKSAVHYTLRKLTRDGVVGKDKRGRLVPKKLYGEVKVLGLIEAGWPSPAEEELVDTMSLDEYLIENKEATYLLRVKGDSMIDAGIQQGDLVIVERTNTPKVGRIVIAEVDGEWTMKYLRKGKDGFYLEAANRAYKPIQPKEDLKVVAVVKGVIRKY